ncbi:MAG: hypothetical protein JWM03_51 [Rhodocyclales bacterium]|nr:hypothetical protein [Rhodocyclales bacterium]MDB5887179.1 hypothetical protein [Rhodocyclales bacterium]
MLVLQVLSAPTKLQKALLIAIPLIIGLGLLVDQHAGPWGQPLVSVLAWAAYLVLLKSESPALRRALLLCMAIATLGEVFLSLVWGLYTYRLHNIPLFVPPGHVLLFWFGLRTVGRIPPRLLDACAAVSCLAMLLLAVTGRDLLSVPLWLLFAACWYFGPARRFYAWMFVIALAMEIYATVIGNWAWQGVVPVLGLPTTNPPLAAGAFYCMLDVIVLFVCSTVADKKAGVVTRSAGSAVDIDPA